MNRVDYLLVAARIASMALAVASYVIAPSSTTDHPVSAALLYMKTSNFMLMLWIPSALAVHLCSLRQLVEPQEHYSYTMVFFQWIFTAICVITASAALGVITGTYFLHNCVGQFQPICRRYELSWGLAFLLGGLNTVVSVAMNWTRLTNGPHVIVMQEQH